MPDRHLDQPVIKLNLTPKGSPKPAVLAFHGRNSGPASMQKLLQDDLGFEDLPAIFPAAADKTWYPDKFMAPLEINKPKLEEALATAKHYHKELNRLGFSDDQIIIMGFSQGACLASHYALSNPAKYKAILVFTGGYVGPEGIDWDFKGDFEQTPVFISTSEIDEWVPPSRAKKTAAQFERLHAKVHFELFKDRPHTIIKEEFDIASELITG